MALNWEHWVSFLHFSFFGFCLCKTSPMPCNPSTHRHAAAFGSEPLGHFSLQAWISPFLFLEQSQGLQSANITHLHQTPQSHPVQSRGQTLLYFIKMLICSGCTLSTYIDFSSSFCWVFIPPCFPQYPQNCHFTRKVEI